MFATKTWDLSRSTFELKELLQCHFVTESHLDLGTHVPFAQGYFEVPAVSFQGCSSTWGKYIYGHGFYHGKKGTRIKA